MKDATEIVMVLDKSSSMQPLQSETITSYNTFIEEQKKVGGEAYVTLILFDTEYHVAYQSIPINEVPVLDRSVYTPFGWTALLDGLGQGIDRVGARLDGMDESEKPDKVIFVVITDGEENSSKEYSFPQIQEKVKHQQEKYNWQFIFLGANIDAFDVGSKLGIGKDHIAQYSASTIGTRDAYIGTSCAVSDYRSRGSVGTQWKKKIN